jgi:hypothetical protein
MCSHAIKDDATCGKTVIMDGLCCRHLKQKCSVCLESVSSTNTVNSKRLSCGHSFHPGCIMNWFVTSDECPACRTKQTRKSDAILDFKEKVEDELRAKYKDAIDSLETENQALKETLRLQSMFVNASRTPPQPVLRVAAMLSDPASFVGLDDDDRRVMEVLRDMITSPA